MLLRLILLCAIVMAAVAAPALTQGEIPESYNDQQLLREKRSSYPGAYYAAPPCASAGYHVAPTYLPVHHAVHHAAYAPHYSYSIPSLPHYRDADEHEMMSFGEDFIPEQEQAMSESMMEHIPLARYAYGAPAGLPVVAAPHYAAPAAAAIGLNAAASGAPGSAIGVFPKANTGGCSVPLLLSCSPTIRSGHIVESHGYGYGDNAYRGVEHSVPHDSHEDSHGQAPAHDPSQHPLNQ